MKEGWHSVINVPKGYKAIDVNLAHKNSGDKPIEFGPTTRDDAYGGYQFQHELILNRGTKFRIDSIDTKDKVANLTVIP
jgi:hypothetical protein